MAVYFSGRRELGRFSMMFDNRAVLECAVFERWEDIDNSLTAWCGSEGTIEIATEVGLTERDHVTLTNTVSTSLGLEGVASLKAKVEEVVTHEVAWRVGEKITHMVKFTAPECGRSSHIVYQKVREYELAYFRRRLLRPPESWDRLLRERTKSYDVLPDLEEYVERCGCDEPVRVQQRSVWRRMIIDLGNVSARVPVRVDPDGMDVLFFGEVLRVETQPLDEFSASLPTDVVPELLKVLGDLTGDAFEARFLPVADEIGRLIMPPFLGADVFPDLIRSEEPDELARGFEIDMEY